MDVPIACSLSDADARAQLAHWGTVLAASVTSADRVSPAELTFRLRPDLAGVDDLLRLAQRERACCPFFEVTLRIEAAGITLAVAVPADAAPILDTFAQLRR